MRMQEVEKSSLQKYGKNGNASKIDKAKGCSKLFMPEERRLRNWKVYYTLSLFLLSLQNRIIILSDWRMFL